MHVVFFILKQAAKRQVSNSNFMGRTLLSQGRAGHLPNSFLPFRGWTSPRETAVVENLPINQWLM
jgi:hypothetical protein